MTITDDSTATPARRALLGAIGAATGVTGVTRAAVAQDGEVETRGCSDGVLTDDDWATGAVTVYAPPGGRV